MNSDSVAGNAAIKHIAIIDDRSCLRDGLARSLRESYAGQVTDSADVQSMADLDNHDDKLHNTIIVYCLGSHHETLVTRNITTIASTQPEALLVVVTDTVKLNLVDFVNSGQVNGIVPSSYGTEQLIRCLNLVHTGVTFVPFEYRFITGKENGQHKNHTEEYEVPGFDYKLTPRQREVLRYVALGKSNKYIAAELSLCESTVKVHVHEVMKRLGATSRTHASYIVSQNSV